MSKLRFDGEREQRLRAQGVIAVPETTWRQIRDLADAPRAHR